MSRYWPQIGQQWDHLGPPLRPCAEDLEFLADKVTAMFGQDLRVLVLGVTREYSLMAWPKGTELTAVDRSDKMIESVWRGEPGSAHCADWRQMPLEPASQHAVLCDGGLSFLEFPDGIEQLAIELHRVLRPGGLCVFRLYVPPETREPASEVARDLNAGRIQDLNHLKVRLWFALHDDPREGVRLGDVWAAVRDGSDVDEFAHRIGWPPDRVRSLDLYRDCEDIYRFPSLDQVRQSFCGGALFEFEVAHTPSYELGESCPTVVFRRLGD